MIIKYKPTFSNEESKKLLDKPIFEAKFKYGFAKFLELLNLSDDYVVLIDEGNYSLSVWSKQ